MARTVRLYTDSIFLEHDAGSGHPERPDRLRAIRRAIDGARFGEGEVVWIDALDPADPEVARRLHTPGYVDELLETRGRAHRFDADTASSPATVDAALTALGGMFRAIDEVVAGEADAGFVIARPPGHHAEPDRAMGFCYLGTIALGADHAIRTHASVGRVLIVDFDVHHGNGTEALLRDRGDVAVINLHQSPLYPGTGPASEIGAGDGTGFNINVPLPAGTGDAGYLQAFRDVVEPAARWFAPDLILVSAGYDAHSADPLAQMNVTTEGFARMAAALRSLAGELCGGRIVCHLEGGYDTDALAASVRATVEMLARDKIPEAGRPEDDARCTAAINATRAAHHPLNTWVAGP